jgi:hypothetical protein
MKQLIALCLLLALSAPLWADRADRSHDRGHTNLEQQFEENRVWKHSRQHRHHWQAVDSLRTAKYRPRERSVILPRGTKNVRLQTTGRGVKVRHAWISYRDGTVQRLRGLRGHLDRWDSASARTRTANHRGRPVLHLVLAPQHRGKRSRVSVYASGNAPRYQARIRDFHNEYSARLR